MPVITIHTATYNRVNTLGRVYRSLLDQTKKDFEWIISDDGSTDRTEDLVKDWLQHDNGLEIIYSKLPHVGFPRALNDGVHKASAPWFMMLDSDDYLLPETVETLLPWLEEIEGMDMIAGIGVTRCHKNGTYMKSQVPTIDPSLGYVDAANSDRAKYNLNMDCFEITRTDLLRKYPFQHWPTEEYAPPQLNYNAMSLDGYKWRWRAAKLYICDYLPDGLTKSNRKVKDNPMGYAMMYNQNLLLSQGFKSRCRDAMQMIALCTYSGNLSYLRQTTAPAVTTLMLIPGLLLGLRRIRQFSNI
jgi:glycosyltransferase involved in cell wall biosynthesis